MMRVIITVIVMLILGVYAGVEFKIGPPDANAQYFATPSRGSGAAGAKSIARIQVLESENQKRFDENETQDAAITNLTNTLNNTINQVNTNTNDLSVIGDHATSSPPSCDNSQSLIWDGASWQCVNAAPEWGMISSKPAAYQVVPPVCSGSNQALQWTGTVWQCASVSGSSSSSGGGGGCASNTGASCNGCGTVMCNGSCSKTTRQCNGGR